MRNPFFGYYPPSDSEYKKLWDEALVVLDTNVLLDFYRLPTTARNELMAVLELMKNRLWIPHQVAMEFQRKRLAVIASERKITDDALQAASELVTELTQKVNSLQIDKRTPGVDTKPLLEGIEQANAKLIDVIKSVHEAQLDISSVDPIRDRLDALLEDRVGEGPGTQEELDSLVKDGDERFKDKIPPGFADADKGKNPNEATYIYDQLRYERKFGDLILWRQIIGHVKNSATEFVILVTGDRKEDWWWREQGKTIGPQPELTREMVRKGGVKLYWMYTSDQFLEHAGKYLKAKVSSQSVVELQQVSSAPSMAETPLSHASPPEESTQRWTQLVRRRVSDGIRGERKSTIAVSQWVIENTNTAGTKINNHGFPDLISFEENGLHGYSIKLLNTTSNLVSSPLVANNLMRGYVEVNEGRLSRYTLIVLVPAQDLREMSGSDQLSELGASMKKLFHRYPVDGLMLGTVLDNAFSPVLTFHQNTSETD